MNTRNLVFLLVTVLGIVADQATKWWVVQNIDLHTGEIVIIEDWLSIVHAQNPGAAFGMFRDFEYRHFIFLGFTVVAVGVILDMFRRLRPSDWMMSGVLGLIMSGAIGNAIDRVRQRVVTDFIRVYSDQPDMREWLIGTFGTNEWPSFNVADSALVVGVLLFVVNMTFFEEKVAESEALDDEPADDDETDSAQMASGG